MSENKKAQVKNTKALKIEELEILLALEKQKNIQILAMVEALAKTADGIYQGEYSSNSQRNHDLNLVRIYTIELVKALSSDPL